MNIRNMLNILKNYRWQSFLLKSYVVIFCVMSIPLGIFTVILSNNYRSNMLSSIKMLTGSSDSTLAYYIDSEFEKIDKMYLNLKDSEAYGNDFSYMLVCEDLGKEWEAESAKNLYRYMGDFVSNDDFISSIYLYSVKSRYVYSTGYPSGNYIDDFQDKEAVLRRISGHGFYSRSGSINYKDYNYISIQKKTSDFGEAVGGTLIYNIDASKLFSAMKESDRNLKDWFIVDDNGLILYSSSDEIKIGRSKERYEILKDDALNAEKIRGDNTVTTIAPSDMDRLSYVFINQYDEYAQSRKMYVFSVILIGMLMLALGLIISAILTVFFYTYISSIVDMLQPYAEAYDVREDSSHSTREMQLITGSILAVTSQNKDLREELSNRLVALKKAQSSMLQMQINPHFLYNTLNTINAIVIGEYKGDTVVSDTITNLSDILRYSLNTTEYLVTLDVEIMYLNTYLEIQRVKYNNKFSVEYDIDDRARVCKALKLSLQPIVENAVIHGITPKKEKGNIKISAHLEGETLKFVVEDDGVGISPEKLNEINKKINNDVFVLNKSLGIENTAKRIRLIFGDEYGLKINTSELGTRVELTIPKII